MDDPLLSTGIDSPPLRAPVVRSAMINVVALARIAWHEVCSHICEAGDVDVLLVAEIAHLRQEISWLQEEIQIKDGRMSRIPPGHRPHSSSTERMTILELSEARGLSIRRTADRFLVSRGTIHSWRRRVTEEGENALLALDEPVNKYPDYVRHGIRRIKALFPFLGKEKISELLCKAGLHVAKSTVGRILKETPKQTDELELDFRQEEKTCKKKDGPIVTAKYPSHVWHIDLTTVPILGRFAMALEPKVLPQRWPFGWQVFVVEDHFSRKAMGFKVFDSEPSSEAIQDALDEIIQEHDSKPKHIISDRGKQFDCDLFHDWCKDRQIKWRHGAVGKKGSIAVVERYNLTMKTILALALTFLMRREAIERELDLAFLWYNEYRPHSTLGGRTPNEVYFNRDPGNENPRYEPRTRLIRGSPCAKPETLIEGEPGDRLIFKIDKLEGRSHLPIISIKRAA